jgi:hypothetical protein
MSATDGLEAAFKRLRRIYTAKTKRAFLADIRGQLEEDKGIEQVLQKPRTKARYVAVTCDRPMNNPNFSYAFFDLLLVVLDALAGGGGIYKPCNQMRALQWNGRRSNLLRVLLFFARNNPQVNFRRALVLPFPIPPAGHKIDSAIHMK